MISKQYTSCGFYSCSKPATTRAPWKVNGRVVEYRTACDEHKSGRDTVVVVTDR